MKLECQVAQRVATSRNFPDGANRGRTSFGDAVLLKRALKLTSKQET